MTDTTKRILWSLLWLALMIPVMWLLEVPSGLPWYQVVGAGVLLGLANMAYKKT